MSMLGMLPWTTLDQPVTVGRFRFTDYEREKQPFGPGSTHQATADQLSEPFRTFQGRSINSGTVVLVDDTPDFQDLEDSEAEELIEAAEVLTFSSLADREFFTLESRYWNRDNLTFYLQHFNDASGSARAVTRRRDGSTTSIWSREVYKRHCPEHVLLKRVAVDRGLLLGLWRARSEAASWNDYLEALQGFNAANTDSLAIGEQSEAVALIGAFERLLDLRRGKEDELVDAVLELLSQFGPIPCAPCRRLPSAGSEEPIATWLRDFFRSRGFWAHGRTDPAHPKIWSRREHLLLGTFVFPFVLKARLAKDGLYKSTERDSMHGSSLNRLACIPEIFVDTNADEFDTHPWQEVMNEALYEQIAAAAYRELEAERSRPMDT